MNLSHRWARWCLLVLWVISGSIQAADRPDETLTLMLSDGGKINVDRFGSSLQRVLWLPAQQETNETRFPLARSMADMGLEVWLPNLPPDHLGIDKESVKAVGEMIELSLPDKANGNGKLYLFTSGQSTAVTGLGLQLWQAARGNDPRFAGLLLAYPDLMTRTEPPVADYAPLNFKAPVAVYIFQPERSKRLTSMEGLTQTLEKAGSVVFTHSVSGVSDGYLQHLGGTEDELMQAGIFPAELKEALERLNAITLPTHAANDASKTPDASPAPDTEPDQAIQAPDGTSTPDAKAAAAASRLEPYPGQPMAPPLKLSDMHGKKHTLKQYLGQVIVLNFWATWCPPCIKEIPSLGRLQKKFAKDDLVVLSVDVGEEKADVQTFLKNIPADYPVLLDEAGDIVKDWKLHAFPSTFIIDREGHIKQVFYGGLEWDGAAVVKQLEDSMSIKAKK